MEEYVAGRDLRGPLLGRVIRFRQRTSRTRSKLENSKWPDSFGVWQWISHLATGINGSRAVGPLEVFGIVLSGNDICSASLEFFR